MAAELLDGSGDGVWLAELAAVTDEDAVPTAICDALRLAVDPGGRRWRRYWMPWRCRMC